MGCTSKTSRRGLYPRGANPARLTCSEARGGGVASLVHNPRAPSRSPLRKRENSAAEAAIFALTPFGSAHSARPYPHRLALWPIGARRRSGWTGARDRQTTSGGLPQEFPGCFPCVLIGMITWEWRPFTKKKAHRPANERGRAGITLITQG